MANEPLATTPEQSARLNVARHLVPGYELLRPLSRGGFGEVHLARNAIARHHCAVKIIFPGGEAVEQEAIRLYAASVTVQDYAVLVPIQHYGQTETGDLFYVMPLADPAANSSPLLDPEQYTAATLAQHLQSHGPLPLDDIFDIADRILLGLKRLHACGLVHCDVKPANVLRLEGNWRLGDFGLLVRRSDLRSGARPARGTCWFMPAKGRLDFSLDVYALGKTLLLLATDVAVPRSSKDREPVDMLGDNSLTIPSDDSRRDSLRTIILQACREDESERYSLVKMHADITKLIRRTVCIQIRIDQPFDTFTPEARDALLRVIEHRTGIQVLGVNVLRGSVLLQLQLTPAQAELLQQAVRAGVFKDVHAVEAIVLDQQSHPGNPDGDNQTAAALPVEKSRWAFWVLLGLLLVSLLVTIWFVTKPSGRLEIQSFGTPVNPSELYDPWAPVRTRPAEELIEVHFHNSVRDDLSVSLGGAKIDNQPERVSILWDPSMRFGIRTIKDKKNLTFEPLGMTNNTVVKIDGRESLFGTLPYRRKDNYEQLPNFSGRWGRWREGRHVEAIGNRNATRSVWEYPEKKVFVTQHIERILGQSGDYDTVLIRYDIENTDEVEHTVGLRFLLDTLIGANDGVPFLIPGRSSQVNTTYVTNQAEGIPDFIQACESVSLANPGLVCQIGLRLTGLEVPDRVTIGAYPDIQLHQLDPRCLQDNTLWDVPVLNMQPTREKNDPRSAPDSCVVIYWDPRPLPAGQKRQVGFTYGLGHVASTRASEGKLGLTSGGAMIPDGEITVTAYVKNPEKDMKVTLKLPEGFRFSNTEATKSVPPGTTGQKIPVTWTIRGGKPGRYTLQAETSTGLTEQGTIMIAPRRVFGN